LANGRREQGPRRTYGATADGRTAYEGDYRCHGGRGDGGSYSQLAQRCGVAVLAGQAMDPSGGSDRRLRIHFDASLEELTDGVPRLATAWHMYRPDRDDRLAL
jgi:hypothetical protein